MYLSYFQTFSQYVFILFSDVLADMYLSYYQMFSWYVLYYQMFSWYVLILLSDV